MAFSIEELFIYWEGQGVFEFLLPFLLVFAIVYGVLQYMKIFGQDKATHVIISIVIGVLSVRYIEFTRFYEEVFPRLGVGLTIILVVLILTGMFATDKSRTLLTWVYLIIGLIVTIAVIYNSASVFGWVDGFGGSPSEWIAWILSAVLLIGVIVVLVMPKIEGDKTPAMMLPLYGGKSN
jgi:predicted ABC-type exoprotein transport system permease subunit